MISAVILIKNEESNIVDCLISLDFCTEIVVVDDNSSDSTLKKISEWKRPERVKVFHRDMEMDFSIQSNFGMNKAKGDWIIFIDADERISPSLREEILTNTNNPLNKYSGYFIKRSDFIWGRWLRYGESGVFRSLRLVRKDSGRWVRRVHPRFELKGETYCFKNPILHYPHRTLREFIKSVDRWSSWHALANEEEGKTSGLTKVVVFPVLHFIRNYIFRLGFLDGMRGFVFAVVMAFHSYLAWSKLYLIKEK